MLEKMMFFRQKTKKIGTCHGFPAVTCAGLSKKSDFFDSHLIYSSMKASVFSKLIRPSSVDVSSSQVCVSRARLR